MLISSHGTETPRISNTHCETLKTVLSKIDKSAVYIHNWRRATWQRGVSTRSLAAPKQHFKHVLIFSCFTVVVFMKITNCARRLRVSQCRFQARAFSRVAVTSARSCAVREQEKSKYVLFHWGTSGLISTGICARVQQWQKGQTPARAGRIQSIFRVPSIFSSNVTLTRSRRWTVSASSLHAVKSVQKHSSIH